MDSRSICGPTQLPSRCPRAIMPTVTPRTTPQTMAPGGAPVVGALRDHAEYEQVKEVHPRTNERRGECQTRLREPQRA